MPVEIFINARPYQVRAVSAEKGRLKQIFYHRKSSPSFVGAVYKGKVSKIMKSLNFAFVDLSLERAGFLYGKDLPGEKKEVSKHLKTGQSILAQIKTDPLRKKGVRLSMEIGLAGLYLVYLPEQPPKYTISRKLTDSEERKRLRGIMKGLDIKAAVIVRTFAQGRSEEELKRDLKQLEARWEEIQKKSQEQSAPGEIEQGEEPLLDFLRDSLSYEAEKIIVDEKEALNTVKKWMKAFRPDLAKKIEFYKGGPPLFQNFNLESQIQRSQQKKVSLKNGGFLIFEELEAFSVIDVNSGSFSGKKSLSKSLLSLNLEAAKVIAEQVQLRRLGGIILVDFVDMDKEEDRKKVVSCLETGFQEDKARPRVFPMGELGLVQITRKRSEKSLSHFMTEPCSSCQGQGRRKTLATAAGELLLKAENFAPLGLSLLRRRQRLQAFCNPEVKKYIEEREKESLNFLSRRLSISLSLKEDSRLSFENFRIEKL